MKPNILRRVRYMVCEICGGKSGVIDTISQDDAVYRKRKCKECGHIFYTEEVDSDGTIFKELFSQRAIERKQLKEK